MNFVKYPSIENSYRQEFVDKIIAEGKADGEWFVTEKIHGANFSIWMNKTRTRIAKRTCLLSSNNDNFYGVQKIIDELIGKARRLYALISKDLARQVECIAVIGELFGGVYPHPEVKVCPEAKKVQKGVYYCPFNDFAVCDIKVDDLFMDFIRVEKYCMDTGFWSVPMVFKGTFAECLEYPNDFLSVVYKNYGLPKIEDNICEGIVSRPNDVRFLYNHSRVILKSKNEKFKEKESRPKGERVKTELPDGGKEALDALLAYVTENRYDSVVSKLGEVGAQDFGKVLGAFAKDVFGNFFKEEESQAIFAYNNLEKAEQKMVNKTLNQSIANLVRKKLVRGE